MIEPDKIELYIIKNHTTGKITLSCGTKEAGSPPACTRISMSVERVLKIIRFYHIYPNVTLNMVIKKYNVDLDLPF